MSVKSRNDAPDGMIEDLRIPLPCMGFVTSTAGVRSAHSVGNHPFGRIPLDNFREPQHRLLFGVPAFRHSGVPRLARAYRNRAIR
ncbi:hypothetical protein ACO0M4_06905 [Streptomyces sp. RGM 3693]|uniref:hypothetical protein n=1 Tax=Streptomyces sp. RGM 3693 TaxID=3413284 RepID=UPI003D2746AD